MCVWGWWGGGGGVVGGFFFQAEDGIRDLVRSRGLGDVYKRQDYQFAIYQLCTLVFTEEILEEVKRFYTWLSNQLP